MNVIGYCLAEKLGVVQSPEKTELTEEQWTTVKNQARERGSFTDVCPICQDELGARQEVLCLYSKANNKLNNCF